MSLMVALGIDAGGSSTRWLLRDEKNVLAQGKTEPITGHHLTAKQREETLTRLSIMLAEVLAIAQPRAVVAGITGLSAHPDAKTFFQDSLAQKLELSSSRVTVYDDIALAYLSAFAPGEGVVVYAGTGSIAYHLQEDGSSLRAGGFGYLLDDAGGGFWIGQAGLKQVLRWMDETGAPSSQPLATHIYDALGARGWTDISPLIYTGGRSKLASLAPAVAKAATKGDVAAINILDEAGKELARLAEVLFKRLGKPLPVAFAGGITLLSPLLTDAFQEALSMKEFRVIATEPVHTAAQLAMKILVHDKI
jgi:N-acetylglucosamine kinase-like BadF-type ATPase